MVDPIDGTRPVLAGLESACISVALARYGHQPRPSRTDDLRRMFWSFELVGRPPVQTMAILEPLMEASGLEAGMFLLSSATFSISRVLTGQLDAYVDIGARLLRDLPGARENFLRAGGGRIICLFPYDIAAACLLAQEAGCCVSDAHGRSLDDLLLMEHGEDQLPSCIIAGSERLHRRILEVIEERFADILGSSADKRREVD